MAVSARTFFGAGFAVFALSYAAARFVIIGAVAAGDSNTALAAS